MKTYSYKFEGTAAKGQSFTVVGQVDVEIPGDMFNVTMRDCFLKLTKGEAVYGLPGVGCNGPYDLDKISIEQVHQRH